MFPVSFGLKEICMIGEEVNFVESLTFGVGYLQIVKCTMYLTTHKHIRSCKKIIINSGTPPSANSNSENLEASRF